MIDKLVIETQKGNTKELGISIIIIYIMLIVYVLLSVFYNKRLGFSIVNSKHSFTLQDMLYYSDNTGTVILILILSSLTIWLLIEQRLYTTTKGILAIVSFILSIFILFLLFKYKDSFNLIIIFFVYTCFTIFSILTVETYKEKFGSNTINEISIPSYILVTINFMILVFLLVLSYSKQHMFHRLIKDIMGLANIVYIVVLIIFIYYISIYPHIESTPIYNSIVFRNLVFN